MLSFRHGKLIARVVDGRCKGELLCVLDPDQQVSEDSSDDSGDDLGIELRLKGTLEPLLDVKQRTVAYVAGPSGSGKTTYAMQLVKSYRKVFPQKEFFLFSRTDYKSDPAYSGMTVQQVKINDDLIKNPIDIEKELRGGSILLFDDCNTIQNDKQKKQIDKLMSDIMEVGRKLDITIIVTNHLVIPNERKIARTVLNEMHTLTVFPKSGASQQIKYALSKYYGLNDKQIKGILGLPSRWVTIHKNYPMVVLYEHGAYIL